MPFEGMMVGKAAIERFGKSGVLSKGVPLEFGDRVAGKATVTASTANTAYSNKLGSQQSSWFRLLVDRTMPGLVANAQPFQVVGSYQDYDHINLTGLMAVGQSETNTLRGGADESTVVFSGRRLTPVQTQMYIPISQNRFQQIALEDNPDQTIQELMLTDWANKVEQICCLSIAGGSTANDEGTGQLSTMDGYVSLADSGAIYDHAGGYINSLLFRELKRAVPVRWRASYPKSDYKWFVPADLEILLSDYLAQRATAWGDDLHRVGEVLYLQGHEVIPCQYFNTTLAGTLTQTGSANTFTSILFARPKNMVIGYRPNVRLFIHPDEEGGYIHMSLWAEWAPQFQSIAEVGKAVNVLMDVTY